MDLDANPDAAAGQAASAVSNNNFIDVSLPPLFSCFFTSCYKVLRWDQSDQQFCQGQTLTNGKQVQSGSCSSVARMLPALRKVMLIVEGNTYRSDPLDLQYGLDNVCHSCESLLPQEFRPSRV